LSTRCTKGRQQGTRGRPPGLPCAPPPLSGNTRDTQPTPHYKSLAVVTRPTPHYKSLAVFCSRSLHSDFLVALLRGLLEARRRRPAVTAPQDSGPSHPPLKVVLMSATLDAGLFAQYFGGCPGAGLFVRMATIGAE
jgi:hypothetical protein